MNNKNPNPLPIGTRFGFLLFGASVLTELNEKHSKIKGFRRSIISNNLKKGGMSVENQTLKNRIK